MFWNFSRGMVARTRKKLEQKLETIFFFGLHQSMAAELNLENICTSKDRLILELAVQNKLSSQK